MMHDGREIARRKRIVMVTIAMLAALVLLALRVGQLSVLDRDRLVARAESQYGGTIQLPAPRGTIFGRAGEIFAQTVSLPSVYASPRYHEVPKAVRDDIAAILDVDRDLLEKRLESDRGFVYLKRRAPREAAEQIMAMRLDGVGFLEEGRRLYPHGSLAAHVVGTANSEMVGLEGVELRYDKWMRAPDRVFVVERDGHNRVRFVDGVQRIAADAARKPGAALELTIDPHIQSIVERELAAGILEYEADAGTVVVLDPADGAIVAMANYPTFDPNLSGLAEPAARRNRAVTDSFEPGSTFKAFLAAAAVESGVMDLEETVDCENGRYRIGRRTIHDTHKYQLLTLPEVIQYSSNIGTSKIAEKIGRDEFARYLTAFGFGRRTAIDLPGEVSGIMNPVTRWGPIELANTSFGQGIAVTPIQLAAAFGAVANGGVLHQPHVLSRAVAEDGSLLWDHGRDAPEGVQAVAPRTAELVTAMLERVVDMDGGTGRNARIEGVRVAGKTGTAQKPARDRRGYGRERIASFAGFAPADDPALVTLVMIDNPKKATYGGTVAAPIFQRVMERALDRVGRRPVVPQEADLPPVLEAALPVDRMPEPARELASEPAIADGETPSFVGLSMRGALARANNWGVPVRFEGSGFVVEQTPLAGAPLTGEALRLRLEPAA